MTGLTAESEALLHRASVLAEAYDSRDREWAIHDLGLRRALPAIEAAAIARALTPDRIARVLHEECEAAWDYIEATDPTRLVTGHFWDVHRATARHIADRLGEGA